MHLGQIELALKVVGGVRVDVVTDEKRAVRLRIYVPHGPFHDIRVIDDGCRRADRKRPHLAQDEADAAQRFVIHIDQFNCEVFLVRIFQFARSD